MKKERVNYDYSQYLGSDWDKNNSENSKSNSAGIYVSNHLSFLDIMAINYLVDHTPGWLAKSDIKKVPVVGFFAYAT